METRPCKVFVMDTVYVRPGEAESVNTHYKKRTGPMSKHQ